MPGGVVGDAGEQVGEIVLRVDTVELGGLCRAPNYAERTAPNVTVSLPHARPLGIVRRSA